MPRLRHHAHRAALVLLLVVPLGCTGAPGDVDTVEDIGGDDLQGVDTTETPDSDATADTLAPPDVADTATEPDTRSDDTASDTDANADAVDVAADADADAATDTDPGPMDCTPRTEGYVTDLDVHPVPEPPELPVAGSVAVDPTFGTTVLRLTDDGDGDDNQVAYSYWDTFNDDSTRGLVRTASLGWTLFDFDRAALEVSRKRALPPTPSGSASGEDAVWSHLEPDVLFAHTSDAIWQLDASTDTWTLLEDLGEELPGEAVWQMSVSADDRVFAFTRKDANYDNIGYVVWERDSDTTTAVVQTDPGIDEVRVDKSGRFVFVALGEQGSGVVEARVHDLVEGSTTDLLDDAPDFNPMHYDVGTATIVGHDNWNMRLTARQLDDPHTFTVIFDYLAHNGSGTWQLGNHFSMRADDESFVTVSHYGSAPGVLFEDEIVQIATDGSESVRRLAHHHSVIGDYQDMPRANISRDGCFVAYTSNHGGSGRRDVYVLDLSR